MPFYKKKKKTIEAAGDVRLKLTIGRRQAAIDTYDLAAGVANRGHLACGGHHQ